VDVLDHLLNDDEVVVRVGEIRVLDCRDLDPISFLLRTGRCRF
jgi:hypothetical protein